MVEQNESESKNTLELVLLNEKVIKIVYSDDDDSFDDVFAELRQCIERGGIWYVENYPDLEVFYGSQRLDNVNCSLVVGF